VLLNLGAGSLRIRIKRINAERNIKRLFTLCVKGIEFLLTQNVAALVITNEHLVVLFLFLLWLCRLFLLFRFFFFDLVSSGVAAIKNEIGQSLFILFV